MVADFWTLLYWERVYINDIYSMYNNKEKIHFRHQHMSDLIIAGVLVLHSTPRIAIVTVSNFKHCHKLHHAKVLGALSDDACEALRLL